MTGKIGNKTDIERLRRERQARALRENLKRRKAQARGRQAAGLSAGQEPLEPGGNNKDR